MKRGLIPLIAFLAFASAVVATPPPGLPKEVQERIQPSPLSTFFVPATRIVWKSEHGVERAESLLQTKPGQTTLKEPTPPCVLTSTSNQTAGIVLDFGVELQGCVELFTPNAKHGDPVPARVRFGESVSEAMAELGGDRNALNDHAVRDQTVALPWCGKKIVGPGGFRF